MGLQGTMNAQMPQPQMPHPGWPKSPPMPQPQMAQSQHMPQPQMAQSQHMPQAQWQMPQMAQSQHRPQPLAGHAMSHDEYASGPSAIALLPGTGDFEPQTSEQHIDLACPHFANLSHSFWYYHPLRGLAILNLLLVPLEIPRNAVDRVVYWISGGAHAGHASDIHGRWWVETDNPHCPGRAVLRIVWNCLGTAGTDYVTTWVQDPWPHWGRKIFVEWSRWRNGVVRYRYGPVMFRQGPGIKPDLVELQTQDIKTLMGRPYQTGQRDLVFDTVPTVPQNSSSGSSSSWQRPSFAPSSSESSVHAVASPHLADLLDGTTEDENDEDDDEFVFCTPLMTVEEESRQKDAEPEQPEHDFVEHIAQLYELVHEQCLADSEFASDWNEYL